MRRTTLKKVENMTINESVERFFRAKKAANLKEDSLETYAYHIDAFIENLDCDTDTTDIKDLTIEDYENFVIDMQEDGKKDTNIASYCRSIRAFLYWNGFKHKVQIPKVQETVKITYTDEELEILLEKPTNDKVVDYEAWCFENICIATGLRLSSVLHIKVDDVIIPECSLNVTHTKTGLPLMFPIHKELLYLLKEYIFTLQLENDHYLFSKANGEMLKRRTIQGYIRDYNQARNVQKTSTHLFRHTFAKRYYLKTKDVYGLMKLLDHADLTETQKYLRSLGITDIDISQYNPQVEFKKQAKAKERRRKM